MLKNIFSLEINSNRIYGLDILRAFAIILVIQTHGNYLLPAEIKRFLRWFILDGVSIFFVLSGFLIGGLLIKLLEKNKPSPRLLINFWIRRWFRTLPNYFLILISLIFIYGTFNFFLPTKYLSKYFFFVQNFNAPHPFFFNVAWSLSIEEWFYLIMPFLVFILLWLFKIPPKTAILIVAILILLSATSIRAFRYFVNEYQTIGEWDKFFRKQVITRLDSIMYGVIGAHIQHYKKDLWVKRKLLLFIIGLALLFFSRILFTQNLAPHAGFYNCVLSFSVTSICTVLLIPQLYSIKNGKGYLYKILTFLSLISYSMYLVHHSLINTLIVKKIPWETININTHLLSFAKYGLYWFLTILCSYLIYKYFEVPTTKLRDSKLVKRILNN